MISCASRCVVAKSRPAKTLLVCYGGTSDFSVGYSRVPLDLVPAARSVEVLLAVGAPIEDLLCKNMDGRFVDRLAKKVDEGDS